MSSGYLKELRKPALVELKFQVLTRDITEGLHPPHWSKHCAPMVLPTRCRSPIYTIYHQYLKGEADSVPAYYIRVNLH